MTRFFVVLCMGLFLFLSSALYEATIVSNAAAKNNSKDAEDAILSGNLGWPRSERFPSVKQRIKLYMGDWYAPPCEKSIAIQFHQDSLNVLTLHLPLENKTVQILSSVEADRIFFLEQQALDECASGRAVPEIASGEQHDKKAFKQKKKALIHKNMKLYCLDALSSLVPTRRLIDSELTKKNQTVNYPPLMVQFGDLLHSHVYKFLNVPYFKKYRVAAEIQDLKHTTQPKCISSIRTPLVKGEFRNEQTILQPIIWTLSMARHYSRSLPQVAKSDIDWSRKKPMAVFRGQLTGSIHAYNRKRPDEENCLHWMRCRLVYQHVNSTLIDAKLTSTRKRLPNEINGVQLVGNSLSISEMLQYKGLIMLEGNDVSSGLKWALLSKSVVLMPRPKFTSWAMEELLVPWVHYVPLNDDATDVEEKMQWVLDHDQKAQRIAERGTLWIEDLCFHPDAALEARLIQEEMVRRYLAHFAPAVAVAKTK